MNRVGERGDGESVWLGWFLHATLIAFAPIARRARRCGRARRSGARTPRRCRRRSSARPGTATGTGAAISTMARRWARRPSDECRIDSIAQSWAVISGAAEPGRAARAMAAVERELIRRDDGLALLFTPPFDHTPHDPGYIKGYPPGIRENGGQYTHAALWSAMAFAALGEGDKAAETVRAAQPDQSRQHARRRRTATRSSPMSSPPTSIRVVAPCRARRLDLVHGLGGLDAARWRGEYSRLGPARRRLASRTLRPEIMALLQTLFATRFGPIRNHGRKSQ